MSDKWSCSTCTLTNPNTESKCSVCGARKSKKSKKKTTKLSNWNCIVCTYNNKPNVEVCGMCGSPSPFNTNLHCNKICDKCTAINPSNLTKCSMCFNKLPDVTTDTNNNDDIIDKHEKHDRHDNKDKRKSKKNKNKKHKKLNKNNGKNNNKDNSMDIDDDDMVIISKPKNNNTIIDNNHNIVQNINIEPINDGDLIFPEWYDPQTVVDSQVVPQNKDKNDKNKSKKNTNNNMNKNQWNFQDNSAHSDLYFYNDAGFNIANGFDFGNNMNFNNNFGYNNGNGFNNINNEFNNNSNDNIDPNFNNNVHNNVNNSGGFGSWFGDLFGVWGEPPKKSNNKHKRKNKHNSKYKNNKYDNNNNNNGANDSNYSVRQFKDLKDVIKNDEIELKNNEKEIKLLYNMYEHVMLNDNNKDKNKIASILTEMFKFIPKENDKSWLKSDKELNEQKGSGSSECMVCMDEFSDKNPKICMKKYCYHNMICMFCFKEQIKVKLKDEDIMPWLKCMAIDCKAPIYSDILLKYLTLDQLYVFAKIFLRMHLNRNAFWIQCTTKKCKFGFVIQQHKQPKKDVKRKCLKCKKSQIISKDPIKNDKGYQDMIKSGLLRLCPKCSLPTMKDKGMCNVMHCGKCGIWWNWKTKETGTNSRALKDKARMNGTLWEPGELQYQMKLQRSNPKEFKRLLERNGIEYKSNYVRGT